MNQPVVMAKTAQTEITMKSMPAVKGDIPRTVDDISGFHSTLVGKSSTESATSGVVSGTPTTVQIENSLNGSTVTTQDTTAIMDLENVEALPAEQGTVDESARVSDPVSTTTITSKDPTSIVAPRGAQKQRGPSKQTLSKLYALPSPVRTFPLPTIVPHNPISLLQLLYTWVTQTWSPPSSHPPSPYLGWFIVENRSVHVTEKRSQKALWSQGFYGKGSLSRSEMSWVDREKRKRGTKVDKTSEEVTRQRRAERQQLKWERARKEREAIDQKLLEEREAEHDVDESPAVTKLMMSPVGPLELLALPNSLEDLLLASGSILQGNGIDTTLRGKRKDNHITSCHEIEPSTTADTTGDVANNWRGESSETVVSSEGIQDGSPPATPRGKPTKDNEVLNGHANGVQSPDGSLSPTKSVNFSPKVHEKFFMQSDPPCPGLAAALDKVDKLTLNGGADQQSMAVKEDEKLIAIEDQEHHQLTMEEALFLSYGLGVLEVRDGQTNQVLSNRELLATYRRASYFPYMEDTDLSPDDPFMLSYVVYHHFRSLGWVVRGGTKFAVDFLLYNRGPPFTHAEFAVVVLPSYSHAFWTKDHSGRAYVSKKQTRSWSWLHCINRVNTQVKKTLVLVYVDIPPPLSKTVETGMGIDEIFKQYKVREIVLKRWSSNRERADKA